MLKSQIFEKYGYILQTEIAERHQEILDFYLSFWEDDSIFDGYYRHFFPPGFIDRNREKAKTVLRDLDDIITSDTIREKLSPIYIYVLRNMIEDWYTAAQDLEMEILPKSVSEYITGVNEEQADYIRCWFTDAGACVEDFEEAYHAELLFTEFAEIMAERFLKDPREAEGLKQIGIEVNDLLDLLPNDLHDRILEALNKDDLTTVFIQAFEELCNNSYDYKSFDENGLNRRVRDFLRAKGYTAHDQTEQGVGENGKRQGSLDILIKENGLNMAIFEGLIHKDRKYLMDHIDKAVRRYNPSGCRSIYIGEYYKNQRFSVVWKNTIKNLAKELVGLEIDTGREGIMLYKTKEGNIDIWVFGINMAYYSDGQIAYSDS